MGAHSLTEDDADLFEVGAGLLEVDSARIERTHVRRDRVVSTSLFAGLIGGGALATRLPSSVAVLVMMVVLAAIDVVGGVLAKSWSIGGSWTIFAFGCAVYLGLFWLYGLSLRIGQLSTVTIGWVVLVTLADMALDRFHYNVHYPTSKWVAAFVAVGMLAYLVTGNGDAPD